MSSSLSGRCLCGAVTVTVDEFNGKVGACHCGMCRRWGGGPSLSIDGGNRVRLGGEEFIRIYSSSEWGERAFCSRCGSLLFFRLKANGATFVKAGLFDELPGAAFNQQIFIDRKPAWYAFANETRDMTEAEFMSQFGAEKG